MNIVNREFLDCARNELIAIVMRFVNVEKSKAEEVADKIVSIVDWNNSALMHKGLSWMAKNYLIKQNMM